MKSFLQGKRALSVPSLRLAPGLASTPNPSRAGTQVSCATSAARQAEAGVGEAHVEVIKEGDKVVRLVITCRCGEKVEVECLYPAGS